MRQEMYLLPAKEARLTLASVIGHVSEIANSIVRDQPHHSSHFDIVGG